MVESREPAFLYLSFLVWEMNITDQVNPTVFHNSAHSCSVICDRSKVVVVNMPKSSGHCTENKKCAQGYGHCFPYAIDDACFMG